MRRDPIGEEEVSLHAKSNGRVRDGFYFTQKGVSNDLIVASESIHEKALLQLWNTFHGVSSNMCIKRIG